MIEFHSGGMTSPREVIEGILAAGEEFERLLPDRDRWGTSERAQRGMRAAEAMVGGPARPRATRGDPQPSGAKPEPRVE